MPRRGCSSSTSREGTLLALAVVAAVAGFATACGLVCTEAGCLEGVAVEFVYREAGQYRFEVTIDGTKTTCTATLPFAQAGSGCDRDDVRLTTSGSSLPPDQQSIGGLEISSTTARSITIHATRDGIVLGDSTVVPGYLESPGPNGPSCEPKVCVRATYAFP